MARAIRAALAMARMRAIRCGSKMYCAATSLTLPTRRALPMSLALHTLGLYLIDIRAPQNHASGQMPYHPLGDNAITRSNGRDIKLKTLSSALKRLRQKIEGVAAY